MGCGCYEGAEGGLGDVFGGIGGVGVEDGVVFGGAGGGVWGGEGKGLVGVFVGLLGCWALLTEEKGEEVDLGEFPVRGRLVDGVAG